MAIKADPQAQYEAALRWVQADQVGQLQSFYRRRAGEPRDQAEQRRINDLMHAAANYNSEKCLRYLAVELGGDIHYAPNRRQSTTLSVAIYCANAKQRARMVQPLMSVAKADELDSRAVSWARAARAAMQMGDDALLRDLAAFAGPERFSHWIVAMRESCGEDAWCLSARVGKTGVIGILLDIPEMKARLIELALSPHGLPAANLADSFGHKEFALAIRGIVASENELAAIESACPLPNAQRIPSSRRV